MQQMLSIIAASHTDQLSAGTVYYVQGC